MTQARNTRRARVIDGQLLPFRQLGAGFREVIAHGAVIFDSSRERFLIKIDRDLQPTRRVMDRTRAPLGLGEPVRMLLRQVLSKYLLGEAPRAPALADGSVREGAHGERSW